MRRRNLLENAAKLTLSIQTITVEPSASTFTFYAMWNGTQIASSSTLSVTYDGTVISGRSIASDGTITANSTQYTATTDDRNGYLEVTYSGQTARVDVTQKKDYVASTSTNTRSGKTSVYTISSVSSLSFYTWGYSNICDSDILDLTISYYGRTSTEIYIDYYDIYASGNNIKTNTITSNTLSNYGNYYASPLPSTLTPSTLYYNYPNKTYTFTLGGKNFTIDGSSLSENEDYGYVIHGTVTASGGGASGSVSVAICL